MTTQTTRIYALETSMRMFGAIAVGAVQFQQPSPASALIFSLSIRQLNRLKCHDMNYEGFSIYAYNKYEDAIK
ncbi:unnamed protein product [Rhizophagus irregularis]|nr:unnamed protein product [Rhizophagus irregularis]